MDIQRIALFSLLYFHTTAISMEIEQKKHALQETLNINLVNILNKEQPGAIPQCWYLQQTFEYTKPLNIVNSVCFNSSSTLLTTSDLYGAHIFDLEKNKRINFFKLESCDHKENSAYFNPSNTLLASTYYHNSEKIIRIFDLENNNEIFSQYDIMTSCFNSSGKLVTISTNDKVLKIFDLAKRHGRALEFKFEFKHNIKLFWINGNHTGCCFNSSGTLLAVTPNGKIIHIYNLATTEKIASLDIPKNKTYKIPLNPACFDPSGTLLAVISEVPKEWKDNVYIFNIKTKEVIAVFEHDSYVNSVCFDSSGTFLAIASNNKAHIFDLRTNKEVAFLAHSKNITSACFDSSGKFFATGSQDSKARIFARYNDYTLEQLQLQYAFLTWLLIGEKDQCKYINIPQRLLLEVAKKHIIHRPQELSDRKELKAITATWNTFPEKIQNAIWESMHDKIQKINTFRQK